MLTGPIQQYRSVLPLAPSKPSKRRHQAYADARAQRFSRLTCFTDKFTYKLLVYAAMRY
jgi:hypothetical protein